MDKQKQIQTEELIGIIQGAVGGCATHWASLIAEEVLKYYKPKNHENSVVLTEGEYSDLLSNEVDTIEKDIAEYWATQDVKSVAKELHKDGYRKLDDQAIFVLRKAKGLEEKVRKETAEKFAEKSKQRLSDKLHRGKALHTTVFGKEYMRRIFKEVVDEIAKEIKEGKV